MDLHMSGERLFVGIILYLFLIVLACGSGYWLARSLPVRFNGEKVLLGLLTGSLAALATYGVERMLESQSQPFRFLMPLGWFFLQGLAGEVTVQLAARRRRSKS